MIRRLLKKKYVGFIRDSLDPIFCTTSPNPVRLWNNFRTKWFDYFCTEGGVILFKTKTWKINELLADLYQTAGKEPETIEKVRAEYEELIKPPVEENEDE